MSPTSQFFNNYAASSEQELFEDLIVESVRIHGIDCQYVVRSLGNFDRMYLTDDQSVYQDAYLLECYLENVQGFGGDREFMSKFLGAEIRDQITMTIPRRTFANEVASQTELTRPREGDLIFFPFNSRVFQIKYVDQYNMMFAFGTFQSWKITCELFEYSNEVFDTGIPELDRIQKQSSINIIDYALLDVDGSPLMDTNGDYLVIDSFDFEDISPLSDNKATSDKSDPILDWSETDPFSEGNSGNIV